MFENIKLKREQNKTLIYAVHGFGFRRSHEYDNFRHWLRDTNYHFEVIDIYEPDDESGAVAPFWISKVENHFRLFMNDYEHIILIGFSMGGVIASYLASKYRCEKLFLIAPAFDYLHIGNISNAVFEKVFMKKDDKKDKPQLSSAHVSCFMEVVKSCKNSIEKVTCPVLMVHGDADEVIPLRSSNNAFDKIPHDYKRLFFIHNGKHRLMLNNDTNYEVFQLFWLFINNKIVCDHDFVPDIYEIKSPDAE